ncbi:hypothetical protein BH10CYA1_BH10CYA1_37970 [soil metagenome]
MCKNNATTTGQGQITHGSGCTCKHAATGGCGSPARRFLSQVHEQPLGLVHVIDPSLIQVGLPNGKGVFDLAEQA